MENTDATNQLLKGKYDLHKSPEVNAAAKRTLGRTGEKVPQHPLSRIQNYLSRFGEITDRENPDDREHGMDAVKRLLYRKNVIKPDEVPEGYFENQRRLAREQGHGDIDISREMRDQLTEVVIADQKSSLDKWVDYLSSSDAPYPDALKYFALRSVLSMNEYDKERKAFTQRSKGTVKPFPDLNREALAYVLDAVEKKYKSQDVDLSKLETEDDKQFDKLLQAENFPKLYAWAIEKVTPASAEDLSGIQGEWVKYPEHSNHLPLVQSLQGHGTGWCTAGESTAAAQLQNGDFYVYYSQDKDGKPTIPRAAIRMEGNRIAEIRGIAPEQNLDSNAVTVVEEKLKEFPDGPLYQKRAHDMRTLTTIENQIKENKALTGEELVFLYEVNASIDGFGYEKDPRIKELRDQRDPEADMPIIFNCDPSQIAHKAGEGQINSRTKAYVGPLEPGIFEILQSVGVEHIYTSFPEGKIRLQDIQIGGKTKEQLQTELQQEKIEVTKWADDMIKSPDFTTLETPQPLTTVRLKVGDLGLSGNPTTDHIYAKAQELGLDLCPAEAGPHMRLNYKDQPTDEYLYMGMKQIADSGGYPDVFGLNRDGDELWLGGGWADPGGRWDPDRGFVFSLRK